MKSKNIDINIVLLTLPGSLPACGEEVYICPGGWNQLLISISRIWKGCDVYVTLVLLVLGPLNLTSKLAFEPHSILLPYCLLRSM
jgi:hypothetical protein